MSQDAVLKSGQSWADGDDLATLACAVSDALSFKDG